MDPLKEILLKSNKTILICKKEHKKSAYAKLDEAKLIFRAKTNITD